MDRFCDLIFNLAQDVDIKRINVDVLKVSKTSHGSNVEIFHIMVDMSLGLYPEQTPHELRTLV